MRLLTGIAVGITMMILWHILGWPVIGWLLIRIPPPTPPDWAPKHRRWVNGIEVTP